MTERLEPTDTEQGAEASEQTNIATGDLLVSSDENIDVTVNVNGRLYTLPHGVYQNIIANIAPAIAIRLARRRWEDEDADARSMRKSPPDIHLQAAGRRH